MLEALLVPTDSPPLCVRPTNAVCVPVRARARDYPPGLTMLRMSSAMAGMTDTSFHTQPYIPASEISAGSANVPASRGRQGRLPFFIRSETQSVRPESRAGASPFR